MLRTAFTEVLWDSYFLLFVCPLLITQDCMWQCLACLIYAPSPSTLSLTNPLTLAFHFVEYWEGLNNELSVLLYSTYHSIVFFGGDWEIYSFWDCDNTILFKRRKQCLLTESFCCALYGWYSKDPIENFRSLVCGIPQIPL